MQGLVLTTLLASLGLAQASTGLKARQTTSSADCATGVHVLAAGGANSDDPSSYGLLGSLAQDVVNGIPGSTMVSVPYDKEDVPNPDPSALPMLQPTAIPGGISTMNTYVAQYHADCPNTKLVLMGYSAGAVIAMSSLCQGGISQSLADSTIIATVVYGDQTRVPGQPYDFGTCTGSGLAASRRDPATCGSFIPGIASYCDTNDPQCCDGPASDYAIHLGYSKEYDGAATTFVLNRWKLLGSSTNSTSSSSSSSTSTSTSSTASASPSSSSTSSGAPFGNTTVSPLFPTSVPKTTGSTMMPGTTVVTSTMGTPSTASATPTPSSTLTPASPNASWAMSPSAVMVVAMFLGAMRFFY